jgi:hypothetical protein
MQKDDTFLHGFIIAFIIFIQYKKNHFVVKLNIYSHGL